MAHPSDPTELIAEVEAVALELLGHLTTDEQGHCACGDPEWPCPRLRRLTQIVNLARLVIGRLMEHNLIGAMRTGGEHT